MALALVWVLNFFLNHWTANIKFINYTYSNIINALGKVLRK